jgi:hypothetical protein
MSENATIRPEGIMMDTADLSMLVAEALTTRKEEA